MDKLRYSKLLMTTEVKVLKAGLKALLDKQKARKKAKAPFGEMQEIRSDIDRTKTMITDYELGIKKLNRK